MNHIHKRKPQPIVNNTGARNILLIGADFHIQEMVMFLRC